VESQPEERSRATSQVTTVGGVVLIGLGLAFLLLQQVSGVDVGRFGWPLFILLPGLGLLGAFAFGGRGLAGLAVPGCVVTTVGLLLTIQNTFGTYQTWAYAWALVPAAVGLGLRLQGERSGTMRLVVVGTRMLEGFLIAFVVFAIFFELILDLSHFGGGAVRGVVGPVLLIAIGLLLLARRRPRHAENA